MVDLVPSASVYWLSWPLMELYVLDLEEIGFVRLKNWLFLYDNVSSMYTLSKFLKKNPNWLI